MHSSQTLFLIRPDARLIGCLYDPKDKTDITYFKTLDPNVEVGQHVVCEAATRNERAVFVVYSVDEEPDFDNKNIGWVVDIVDEEAFAQIKAEEAEALDHVRRAEKRAAREELAAKLIKDQDGSLSELAFVKNAPQIESN